MRRTPFKGKTWVRKPQNAHRKKKPLSLRKVLDKLFSLFIRQRGASSEGLQSCYTCGLVKHWKQLQCGHFVPRQYLAVRYDETNCQPQCYACNILYNGQPSAFAIRLEKDYGVGTVARLEARRLEITKDFPYEEKITHYNSLISS